MIRDPSQPLPKEAPEYLTWVRSLPSAASGHVGCIAHHRIGHRYSQRKVSDFESMPLLDSEHRTLHGNGVHEFERGCGKTEKEMICDTLLEAIRQGVLVFDARAARELAG